MSFPTGWGKNSEYRIKERHQGRTTESRTNKKVERVTKEQTNISQESEGRERQGTGTESRTPGEEEDDSSKKSLLGGDGDGDPRRRP